MAVLGAEPPIHWLSPIIRSQSLPLEFSSLSMRSAKFGQGTNSNFIWMPVSAEPPEEGPPPGGVRADVMVECARAAVKASGLRRHRRHRCWLV